MSDVAGLETRAAELRSAFDRSFALPPSESSVAMEDVLSIRVAGAAYAIRLREIAGIVARRKLTPVPAAASHLLGVAGIRGAILPVFDLASVLGHGPTLDSPRWTVLCGLDEPLGLGFSEFEGYLRTPWSSFHADDAGAGDRGFVREVVRTETGVLPVIEIPAVIASLKSRASHDRPAEEK